MKSLVGNVFFIFAECDWCNSHCSAVTRMDPNPSPISNPNSQIYIIMINLFTFHRLELLTCIFAFVHYK